MAHRTHSSANRFAQSATHATDCPDQDGLCPTDITTESISDDAASHVHSYTSSTASLTDAQQPLRVHVERVVREYFVALENEVPTDLYELILKEVELPLLTVVLEQTRGNQTKCAQILGLNRGTLRKKMKAYNLM